MFSVTVPENLLLDTTKVLMLLSRVTCARGGTKQPNRHAHSTKLAAHTGVAKAGCQRRVRLSQYDLCTAKSFGQTAELDTLHAT